MRLLLLLVLFLAASCAAAKESANVSSAEIAAAAARRDAVGLARAMRTPGPMVDRPGGQCTRAEAEALLAKLLEPMAPAARAKVMAEAAAEPKPAKPEKAKPKP